MANFVSALTGAQMDDALTQMNNRVPEGWAVGERDGVPVGEESLYYHNNAKYYAEQAQAQAESAEESAESASQVAQETADAVIAQAFVQESATPGSVVTIDDGADNIPLKDLKVNLDINQPLNGQANPYPAGGGKNKLPNTATSKTENGITFTVNDDGSVKVTGTATALAYLQLVGNDFTLAPGSYILSGSTGGGGPSYNIYLAYKESGGTTQYLISSNGDSPSWTVTENTTISLVAIRVANGATVNATFYPMLRLSTESADYAPYENICPIYPITAAAISRTGKNLFDYSALQTGGLDATTGAETTAATARRTGWLNVHPNADYTLSGQSGNLRAFLYDANKTFISSALLASGGKVTTTASTAYLRISGGETNYTATVQLEQASTATTYEAFKGQEYLANIGVQQWDEDWEVGTINNDTGVPEADANNIRSKNFCPCIAETSYFFGNATVAMRAYWYDKDETFISNSAVNVGGAVVTAPAGACYFKVRTTTSYGSTYLNDIKFNFPARFTDYFAYTGHTVHGGELDVTTGVLTSKFAMVDLGSLTWSRSGDSPAGGFIAVSIITGKAFARYNMYCDQYATSDATAHTLMANLTCIGSDSNARIYIRDDNFADAESFKSAMAGHKLVYELATPISIQLDVIEVNTLRGDNVIWADCGDITNCEYRADLKLYIDKVVG